MPRKLTPEELMGRVKTAMESGGTLAGSRRHILLLETRCNEQAAELDAEKDLWTSDPDGHRHQGYSKARMYIRREHMEAIIENDDHLTFRTGLIRGQFWFLVTVVKEQIRLNGSRLWGFELDRASDPGKRCALSVEQALLLYLTRIRMGRVQKDLEVEFGVDQSTVSRYLDSVEEVLGEILPTARNITKEMNGMKSTKEITVLIPGFDGTVSGRDTQQNSAPL